MRDTKLDRQQHEATGKHQGSIQRSLRTLHKEHEREDRQKQRAKDEVARLNGLVSGTSGKPSRPSSNAIPSAATSSRAQASLDDRKTQMKQLADMGVAIPEQFRGDLALAGEWEAVSEKRIQPQDSKPESLSYGVRKRKLPEDEQDENDDIQLSSRKADFGSRYRMYPGIQDTSSTQDIEALLHPVSAQPSAQSNNPDEPSGEILSAERPDGDSTKLQPSSNNLLDSHSEPEHPESKPNLKDADEAADSTQDLAPVVFKKRKFKASKIT